MSRLFSLIILILVGLCGCSHRHGMVDTGIIWRDYQVERGDTLYALAKRYQIDSQILASKNGLHQPYIIRVGQLLRVPGKPLQGGVLLAAPVVTISAGTRHEDFNKLLTNLLTMDKVKRSHSDKGQRRHSRHPVGIVHGSRAHGQVWMYPAKGKISSYLSKRLGKSHGIDIVGVAGASVVATRAGTVIYVGSGGRGYGELIIIRHGRHYLSAYAYNRHALVHEGDQVHQGQKIAIMGVGYHGKHMVHFEIRRDSRSLNPLGFLRP